MPGDVGGGPLAVLGGVPEHRQRLGVRLLTAVVGHAAREVLLVDVDRVVLLQKTVHLRQNQMKPGFRTWFVLLNPFSYGCSHLWSATLPGEYS